MTAEAEGATWQEEPVQSAGESPLSASQQGEDSPLEEHPEVLVGAAFVGGFALAQILKRLGE
jgi:hypothetical protein